MFNCVLPSCIYIFTGADTWIFGVPRCPPLPYTESGGMDGSICAQLAAESGGEFDPSFASDGGIDCHSNKQFVEQK